MSTTQPAPPELECRFCRSTSGEIVLDAGRQPAADHFPLVTDPGPDPTHPLRMWLCARCHLAQLAEDPTTPEEPRGQEPEALIAQAHDAVSRISGAGLFAPGQVVAEYGSPHGGSWMDLLTGSGLKAAATEEMVDVLVDNIGMMHDPDQAAGLAARAARLRPDGVLLFQFHSLASIVRGRQWNALRHGHFAYYSTPALTGMLGTFGLIATTAFWFPLFGGTVLLAATRDGRPDATVRDLDAQERSAGVLEADVVGGLQGAADAMAGGLARFLAEQKEAGRRVLGYSAASRSVALLHHAGVGRELLPAVADGSRAKHGRRIPGSGIPVISPAELVEARPDSVVLFVDDLLAEVRSDMPQIEAAGGAWVLAGDIASPPG